MEVPGYNLRTFDMLQDLIIGLEAVESPCIDIQSFKLDAVKVDLQNVKYDDLVRRDKYFLHAAALRITFLRDQLTTLIEYISFFQQGKIYKML